MHTISLSFFHFHGILRFSLYLFELSYTFTYHTTHTHTHKHFHTYYYKKLRQSLNIIWNNFLFRDFFLYLFANFIFHVHKLHNLNSFMCLEYICNTYTRFWLVSWTNEFSDHTLKLC